MCDGKTKVVFVIIGMLALGVSGAHAVQYTGSLSSPPSNGLESSGQTWASPPGFRVDWEVEQTDPSTWHYKYTFSNESGGELSMLVSHMIITLSDDIESGDVFNFGNDIVGWELNTFEASPGNPGFPAEGSVYGIKLDMGNDQLIAEFDSVRQPMWGDFYAKDGGTPQNWAFNASLGVEVDNLHDYTGTPVDIDDVELYKVLVPNNVPEPTTLLLFGLGGIMLRRRKA